MTEDHVLDDGEDSVLDRSASVALTRPKGITR
jgi:hypothetical protein